MKIHCWMINLINITTYFLVVKLLHCSQWISSLWRSFRLSIYLDKLGIVSQLRTRLLLKFDLFFNYLSNSVSVHYWTSSGTSLYFLPFFSVISATELIREPRPCIGKWFLFQLRDYFRSARLFYLFSLLYQLFWLISKFNCNIFA